MPIPRTVLIDTNIFEQHGYDFTSQPIETFVALAQVKHLTLLLPDAIRREIRRHIAEKSAKAQSALKKARHEAPFLQKWAHWPTIPTSKTARDEIAAVYLGGWDTFLKNFKLEDLGYESLGQGREIREVGELGV